MRQQQVLKATQNCETPVERKMVGKVSHKERDEILALFERKNGLNELIRSLVETDDEVLRNHHFYEKIVADMGNTATKFQQWWDAKARQYRWENAAGHVWEIDFDTCRIFLKKEI